MSTMAGKALTQQKKAHDLMATELSGPGISYQCLPGMSVTESTSAHLEALPLFSRQILTVEQLSQIQVDPDIQVAVSEFLKGLTTQMFARIVRNGSSEVGSWLGAKIQGERDGWAGRLRMAMEEIELHRKNALQGQVLLQETMEQLRMLVDCFEVPDEARRAIPEDDPLQGVQKCVEIILECCNAMMEDRFECCQVLEATDPMPDRLSSVLKILKTRVEDMEEKKNNIEKQFEDSTQENKDLTQRNEHLLDQVNKVQEQTKNRQTELEALKTQLKELDKVVKIRKNTTAEKCAVEVADQELDVNVLRSDERALLVSHHNSAKARTLQRSREEMLF
nr:hypothetical protein BaRGS_018238 [Batillaria attramentaria]